MMTGLVAGLCSFCGATARGGVVIQTVTVGNSGNANDIHGDGYGGDGYGGVDYVYNIGTYEVTAGQYRDFLNAVDPAGSNLYGLYNGSMDSDSYGCQITWNPGSSTYDFSGGTVESPGSTAADWENRPVNFVSWGDSARFSNWLHNGQGSGDTETGSYLLNGAMTNFELMAVVRKPDATWVIPSENEWYKAAYYNGDSGVYYDYPTSSDSVPSNDLVEPIDPGNNATFWEGGYTIGSPYWRTEVGAHENSNSPFGTFDQGGNLREWNEAALRGSYRGLRGGSFGFLDDELHAAHRGGGVNPSAEGGAIGFRVAEVPEPATIALLAFGAVGVFGRRRR